MKGIVWEFIDVLIVLGIMALIVAGMFGVNLHWENLPFVFMYMIFYLAGRNAK